MDKRNEWQCFRDYFLWNEEIGFGLDLSKGALSKSVIEGALTLTKKALDEMRLLENGAIANPDEGRMVGHYWLRTPERAPESELAEEIVLTRERILEFAGRVHSGQILSASGGPFAHLLLIGIGGSALGPQLLADACSSMASPMDLWCFDNTDPDGMQRVLARIPDLSRTLCLVISKSGGTKETRNGMLVAEAAFKSANLSFPEAAVAITEEGSLLDQKASSERWLARFPMWDWVGGRTSLWGPVGLLPGALLGIDTAQFLAGAAAMDAWSAPERVDANPALLLALSWYQLTNGKAEKAMVVLPYKDRLSLMGKYLQQLVMESLGKELNLQGQVVNQGLTVYGNKGSTDQHAYVQQLREGPDNFFALFIDVLRDQGAQYAVPLASNFRASQLEVEENITSGDYLFGFAQGTREALSEKGRGYISLILQDCSERCLGALLALFERAVGYYASFVGINAYHQPGVEAGKAAAAEVLELQKAVLSFLQAEKKEYAVDDIIEAVDPERAESIFRILLKLAANQRISVQSGADIFSHHYKA